MFIQKKNLSVMLKVFYRLKSVARLRRNMNDRRLRDQNISSMRNGKSSKSPSKSKSASRGKIDTKQDSSSQKSRKDVKSLKNKLMTILNKKLDKQYLFDLRFCFTQWVRCALFFKMKFL